MFRENRLDGASFDNSTEGWGEQYAGRARLSWLKELHLKLSREYHWVRECLSSPILDAGCGAGQWVAFLQNQGYRAHGLDFSPDLIASNRKRYPDSEWSVGDVRQTGLPDNHFGGLISWGVIEHDVEGPQAALREFYRVLKPGGACVVTVPADHQRQRDVGLIGNPQNSGHFHQYYFTPEELAAEVRKAGFEVVAAELSPKTSIALAAPGLYMKHAGTRLFILARIAALFANKKQCASLSICVGRKPAT